MKKLLSCLALATALIPSAALAGEDSRIRPGVFADTIVKHVGVVLTMILQWSEQLKMQLFLVRGQLMSPLMVNVRNVALS